MSVGRRRFMEIAGFGAAGIVVGCSKEAPTGGSTPPASQGNQQAVTLRLLLWGGALYAFKANGASLEVAYLTKDPGVPGCTFVPHTPMIEFAAGGGRVVPEKTTATVGPNGEWPAGEWRISAQSIGSASALAVAGLGDAPEPCTDEPLEVSSVKYVPQLISGKSKINPKWREKFDTRVVFDKGTVQAQAPFHVGGQMAKWDVKGPGAADGLPFTDTLLLTLPLSSNFVTFESAGKTITLAAAEGSDRISARLMAHPHGDGEPEQAMKKGQEEPHFCALYTVFDPVPEKSDRAELAYNDWCKKPTTPAKKGGPEKGPSPRQYCTGGRITV